MTKISELAGKNISVHVRWKKISVRRQKYQCKMTKNISVKQQKYQCKTTKISVSAGRNFSVRWQKYQCKTTKLWVLASRNISVRWQKFICKRWQKIFSLGWQNISVKDDKKHWRNKLPSYPEGVSKKISNKANSPIKYFLVSIIFSVFEDFLGGESTPIRLIELVFQTIWLGRGGGANMRKAADGSTE